MSTNILVSVIVPVYNAEAYLRQCLDTLVKQTLKEIEIICIDDGSSDRSPDILTEYAQADTRVRVIRQKNSGAGAARNRGLLEARGEYIAFQDADDFAELTMLEKAYKKASVSHAEICLFGIGNYDDSTGKITARPQALDLGYIPLKQPFSPMDVNEKLFQITSSGPTSKLFRRDFIQECHLCFAETLVAEDLYFVYLGLAQARRIVFIKDTLIYYRQGIEGHLMSRVPQDPQAFFRALTAVRDELKKQNAYEPYERSFREAAAIQCDWNFRQCSPEILPNAERRIILETFGLQNINAPTLSEKRPQRKTVHAEPAEWIVQGRFQNTDMQPTVSVIIPVYNVEPWLEDCLKSVLSQEDVCLEVICINDGSEDGSAEILSRFAESDDRVSVLYQKNSGQAKARNEGLRFARGKYIQFVDSDDRLEPGILSRLVLTAEENEADFVLFDAQWFFDSPALEEKFSAEMRNYYQRKGTYEGTFDGMSLLDRLCANNDIFLTPWMFLLRRDFLDRSKIQFRGGIILEDNLFDFCCFLAARRCVWLNEAGYAYRVRENSTMTAPVSMERLRGCYICWLEMQSALLDYGGYHEDHPSAVYLPQAMRNTARHLYLELKANGDLEEISSFDRLMIHSLSVPDPKAMGAEEKLTKLVGYRTARTLLAGPRKIRGILQLSKSYGFTYIMKWLLRSPVRFVQRILGRL